MMDHKRTSAPLGGKLIDLSERYEVHYWCEKFGVSPDQLQDAVELLDRWRKPLNAD